MPSTQSKARRFLIPASILIILASLTGCSAIGTNKPAALQVTSIPEASIFLDGKHLGKTPYSSDQLKSGEHSLKIAASEASFVATVNLSSGTLTVINRELTGNFLAQAGEILSLEPDKAGLFVASSPKDANLVLDGRLMGTTPILIEDIKEGDHKLFLTHDGYIDHELAVKTSAKYQLVADVTLASIIAKQPQASPKPIVKVEILTTPQGFLRVRKDPSLASFEVGRVNTGDQLEVIQEIKDWVQVKFEGKQGWISSTYTNKL